ncbi:MAG TPA: PKD domain-containing protein [Ktedonobacterales bacterium]|nr:PKD domain-containing protein [Ktedonobacterales bacterium]
MRNSSVRFSGLRVRLALRLAAMLAAALAAIVLGLPGALTGGGQPVAYACGLGASPTMLANHVAAMLYPGSTSSSATAPIIGEFAPTYVAKQPITFDEDLSQLVGAPPKSSLHLHWDFGDGSTADTLAPKHTYAAPGTYPVVSFLLDSGSLNFFDSAQITVVAAPFSDPPVAVIHASATAVAAGSKVTFDATGSHAVAGTSLKYSWNFADSDTATGPQVTHTFGGAKLGSSFVTLIVTDSRGARGIATSPIVVVQQLPTAQISASATSVYAGQQISFDASGSAAPSVPPNDQLTGYTWDFGDGSQPVKTTTPTATHTYTRVGHYTVTVQAYDQQGAYGTASVALSIVAVNNTPPAGPPWPLFGGIFALVALVGGYLIYQAQQRRAALARQAMLRQQNARARRVPPGQSQGRRPPPGHSASGPRNPYNPYPTEARPRPPMSRDSGASGRNVPPSAPRRPPRGDY